MRAAATVGAVLMASGAGSRFGSNKLLHPVEGRPLIQRAFAALPAALFDRAVVVSRYPEVLSLAAQAGYHAFENPFADLGQSRSVTLGLAAVEDLDGALFAVCDQPWLTTESIKHLLNSFQESPDCICALSWGGKRGNPALFPREFYPELFALTGDAGGGAVIRAHPDRLVLVEAADPRELRDVDTLNDL